MIFFLGRTEMNDVSLSKVSSNFTRVRYKNWMVQKKAPWYNERDFDISVYALPAAGKGKNILIPKCLGCWVSLHLYVPDCSWQMGIYRINRRVLTFAALPNPRKPHLHFYFQTYVQ